jgi:DNA invertase Pin-like site-specific DNA recombinase
MKVALYCRVSTKEQHTENQRISLVKYAESLGYKYEIYEEVMSTRGTRPVKQEILKKLRSFELDGVIVFKLDRWARSSTELILELEELHKKGISFISMTDNINLDTASGKLMVGILAAFAQFERDIISERTREGLKRAKANGKKPGRPFGSKDKKRRRKAGYLMRHANIRKKIDVKKGVYKDIDDYVRG